MNYLILYLIKTSMCLIVLYSIYSILLSKTTFYRFNRIVLLMGVIFCCILPIIRIPFLGNSLGSPITYLESLLNISYTDRITDMVNIPFLHDMENNEVDHVSEKAHLSGFVSFFSAANRTYSFIIIISLLYLLVVFVKTILFLRNIFRIQSLKRRSEKRYYEGCNLYVVKENFNPFCWGKSIYISEKDLLDNEESILLHETMHIRQFHTFDLVYLNLMINIFWFNPFIYLLYSEIKLIHEYEADSEVLNLGINALKYQLLIVRKSVGARNFNIASSFNHSQLKARINMMLKEKTKKRSKLRVFSFLPAAFFVLSLFSGSVTASSRVMNSSEENLKNVSEDNEMEEFLPVNDIIISGSKATFNLNDSSFVVIKDFSTLSFVKKLSEIYNKGKKIDIATLKLPESEDPKTLEILKKYLRGREILKLNIEK